MTRKTRGDTERWVEWGAGYRRTKDLGGSRPHGSGEGDEEFAQRKGWNTFQLRKEGFGLGPYVSQSAHVPRCENMITPFQNSFPRAPAQFLRAESIGTVRNANPAPDFIRQPKLVEWEEDIVGIVCNRTPLWEGFGAPSSLRSWVWMALTRMTAGHMALAFHIGGHICSLLLWTASVFFKYWNGTVVIMHILTPGETQLAFCSSRYGPPWLQ